jgi:hypothetical protein
LFFIVWIGYIEKNIFYKINYFSFMILDDSNKMKKKNIMFMIKIMITSSGNDNYNDNIGACL